MRHQTDRGHVKILGHMETDWTRFKIRSRNRRKELGADCEMGPGRDGDKQAVVNVNH